MTTTIADAPGADAPAGLVDALLSEFTKIRTVRSTYWVLGILIVGSVIFGSIASAADASITQSDPSAAGSLNPASVSLGTYEFLAPLLLMVLGALVITSEYATGMIRTTFTVQPRRETVFTAKALVFTGTGLIVGLVTALIAYLIGQGILSGSGNAAGPGMWQAVAGLTMYATLIGLLSYGVGVIIRNTAGTIVTMAGIMFILPLIAAGFSLAGITGLSRWLPTAAGSQLLEATTAGTGLFAPWTQLLVTALWTVIALGAGACLLNSRDA